MNIKLNISDIDNDNEDFIAELIKWSIDNILDTDCKVISFGFEDKTECRVTIR